MKICCFTFLVFSLISFSQNTNTENLVRQFEQQQLPALPEKLFVHTGNTFYLAGEIIWFKIYAVDGILNKPFTLSKVVYVEVLDKQQKAVLQAKIPMEDATGSGSFLIPVSMQSGNYTLRAYTKWMKNFAAYFFYEQPITIVNTLKELNIGNEKNEKSYTIEIFPEGGNLVYGLQSKVAFKFTNQDNVAVDCKGVLINQRKDTVTHFASLKFGLGSFTFTPEKNNLYTVIVQLPDTVITKQISGILGQGYVMNVENTDNGFLKIGVYSNAAASNPSVYLFTHTRNSVKTVQANFLVNGQTFFLVDKKLLGDGISHLTIFNGNNQPVCERLYFKNPKNKLEINLVADKKEYITRDKVNIELNTKDHSDKITAADMSLSVFKVDSFQSGTYNDILGYLMLSSELKGKIDSAEYYFNNNNIETSLAADNLMLTQGWRRFKWDDILQQKKSFFKFMPEAEGHVLEGKIINKITGRGAENIMAYLSVPEYYNTFKTSLSKQNGSVIFTIKNIYGVNEIVLQTNNEVDSIYKIDINNPYANSFSFLSLPVFSLSEKWKNDLINRSINMQAENAYQTDKKLRSFSFKLLDTALVYGLADKQYNLDDYTRFITMEEVIQEYVEDVRARKVSDNYQLRVFNAPLKTFFDTNPLVLIDGIPVFNNNKIMAVDPLKIKKIEVVEQKYFFGNLISNGILHLKTYQGDLGGYQLDPNAIVLEYEGLQQQREFYSPVYSTKQQIESRIPDFRNQLLWLPKIKTDITGKTQLSFFTSDLAGKYVIIVQGITKEGLSGSKAISFETK